MSVLFQSPLSKTRTLMEDGEVADHATQHQDGGSDEVAVTGLSGLLADAQTPLEHDIISAHSGFPGELSSFMRGDGEFTSLPDFDISQVRNLQETLDELSGIRPLTKRIG